MSVRHKGGGQGGMSIMTWCGLLFSHTCVAGWGGGVVMLLQAEGTRLRHMTKP